MMDNDRPPREQDKCLLFEPLGEALRSAFGGYSELFRQYNQCHMSVVDLHRSGNPASAALFKHEQDTKLDLKTIDLDKLQSLDDYKQWFELEKAASAERVNQDKQMYNLIKCVDNMIEAEKSIRKEFAAELVEKAGFFKVWEFEKRAEKFAPCKANFIPGCRAAVQSIKAQSRG